MNETIAVARRTVLAGAGAVAGSLALGSCASVGETPTTTGRGSAPPDGGAAEPLARLDDIPVGGAVSAKDADGKPILVAQPEPGTAVAFSAICTHMGCTVAPGDDELACPCHGSAYDASSGEVLRGPAERNLAEVAVHVQDGAVVLGPA